MSGDDVGMDTAAFLGEVATHGIALADSAERAGVDAEVPSCPTWMVRDLVGHVGMVHRWAGEHVRHGRPSPGQHSELVTAPAEGLFDWFREGHAGLLAALADCPEDRDCFTFLAGAAPGRAFWARRQAHETAIHRADAESALGRVPDLDRGLALDGIGELLEGFYGRPGGTLHADPPVTLRVAPDDADVSWWLQIGPAGRIVSRDAAGPVDCTLHGRSVDLYLDLWNRTPAAPISVDGDARVHDLWRERARVAWS